MKIWNVNKAGRREIKYVNLSSMPVFKVANIAELKQELEEGRALFLLQENGGAWHETQVSSLLMSWKKVQEKIKSR